MRSPWLPPRLTGTVELYDGTTRVGTATLAGGAASVALPAKSLEVGSNTLVVKYLGSSTHAASQGTVTVTVTKAKPKVKVDKPKKIRAGEKAKIKVGGRDQGLRGDRQGAHRAQGCGQEDHGAQEPGRC